MKAATSKQSLLYLRVIFKKAWLMYLLKLFKLCWFYAENNQSSSDPDSKDDGKGIPLSSVFKELLDKQQ